MTFITPSDMAQWFVKVRRNMSKIKIDSLDDEDMDYIEYDILMQLFLEEFKTKKRGI